MSQQTSRQSLNNYFIDISASTSNHGDSSVSGTIAWALSQIGASGYGTIKLGPGNYYLGESLVIPGDSISIIGSGYDTILVMDQDAYDDNFINVSDKLNFTLKDLQLNGASGTLSTHSAIVGVFNIGEVSNLTIDNVYFNDLTEGAIDLSNLTFSNITNCTFESIDSAAAILLTTSIHNNVCNNIILTTEEGIKFDSCGSNNVCNNSIKFFANGSSGISAQNDCANNNVSNNNFDGNGYDITFGMIYCEGGVSSVNFNNFSNNTFRNTGGGTGNGITISNGIENNLIGNNFDELTGNGIEFVGTTHYNNISDNNFNNITGIPIKLTSLSNYNNIIGNNLSGFTSVGINLLATSTYNNISNNILLGPGGSTIGIGLTATSNFNRINNNIVSTVLNGVKIDGNSDSNIVINNLFSTMGAYGVLINNANCDSNTVNNNKFNACSTGYVSNAGTGTIFDLSVNDSVSPARQLLIKSTNTGINADRTLTIDTVNADRTLTISGNPTINDWFDQSVKTTSFPQFYGKPVVNNGDAALNVTTAHFGKSIRFAPSVSRTASLPTGIVGYDGARITFIKTSGVGTLVIDAAATDYIEDSTLSGTIYTTDTRASITLEYVFATLNWQIVSASGTWTTT
jgi:hypothetical protein